MPTTTEPATPEALLARFALERFRPGQREAVQAALDGRDALVVMPTGGGKSLCYQLPALAGRGLVVVVSPLIALMADQFQRLERAGVRAAMLASGMEDGHNARALREIEEGHAQLVLAAPERFASAAFRRAVGSRRVGLFVVDEAHCVTEWGHDFRPDYLRLHAAIESLGAHPARPPVMAATATATPRVAREIAARLGLHHPVSIRSGFDRPNLTFDVVCVEGKGAMARKRAALLHALGGGPSGGAPNGPSGGAPLPAIVYCGTRKDTEEVAAVIAGEGISTVRYHAGMTPEARRESQAAFMAGDAEVVVATNAFGMGVDKANVRTVAHWALPTSLEAYYQEAGRAGRDGESARALLLAARVDLGRLIRFNKEREMTVEDVRRFVGRLRARASNDDVGPARGAGGGETTVTVGHGELDERERVLLSVAERAGAVELEPGGREGLLVRLTGKGRPRDAWLAIKAARDRGWESYRSIKRYSDDGHTCRRRQILHHFGDHAEGAPTGRCCDVCEPDPALVEAVRVGVGGSGRSRGGGRAVAPGGGRAGSVAAGGLVAGSSGMGPGYAAGSPAGNPAAEELPPVDERAFEALRAWRLQRAEGKPAYTVATDAALRGILQARPGDVGELLAVRGVGPAFCERHGESVLGVLATLGDDTPVNAAVA